jgi:hypothetical protein
VDGVGEGPTVRLGVQADVEALLGVAKRHLCELALLGHHLPDVGRPADLAQGRAVVEELRVGLLCSGGQITESKGSGGSADG